MKQIKKELPPKISLAVSLVALVFLVMLLSILSAGLIAYLLIQIGILDLEYTASPIRDMMKATKKVSQGNFSVMVNTAVLSLNWMHLPGASIRWCRS